MYCSTTSYSAFSSLRQHMCISSQILWIRNPGTAYTGPKVQGILQGCSQDFGLPQSSQGSIQIDWFSSKLSQWLLIGFSVSQAVGLRAWISWRLLLEAALTSLPLGFSIESSKHHRWLYQNSKRELWQDRSHSLL